jgi:hypothetical protein
MAAAAILIVDETAARKPIREFRLELASERISAEELIRRRVRAEVDRWRAHPQEIFAGLVEPTGAERALNGVRVPKERKLDSAKLERAAIEAFTKKGFLMFVGDRQVVGLDSEIVVTADLEVRFVRLVPLVGG